MKYLAWNDAIFANFFNEDKCGTRVFLYVTKEVVNEIGAPYDADLYDFLDAVKTGPPWNSRHGWSICQQALQALDGWRARHLDYPPYLAYLALFALADTVEVEGFSRASYYPGLRLLLGEEPAAGGYASFDKMYELWFDLEAWSNEDKNGELGIFHADILGSREYVGLPKAQTILTDDERHKLPLLFAENGFDPSSPPTDRELCHLLARETHHYLLPHTKHLLSNRGSEESASREVLLDAILDELEDWDGTVPPQAELGEKARSALGNLRLAMALDRTAKTVHFSLRCRSTRAYPEEGLQLVPEGGPSPLYCYEDWQGWSTTLSEGETQSREFDAAHYDWRAGLTLTDGEHAWRTSFSKRSVRVMISAAPFGFDGFIEESQIPQGKSFYLLAHMNHAETLHTWGQDSCTGFTEVETLSGMPHGWVMYSVEAAHTDSVLRDALPFLAFPTLLRIHLRGALKIRGTQLPFRISKSRARLILWICSVTTALWSGMLKQDYSLSQRGCTPADWSLKCAVMVSVSGADRCTLWKPWNVSTWLQLGFAIGSGEGLTEKQPRYASAQLSMVRLPQSSTRKCSCRPLMDTVSTSLAAILAKLLTAPARGFQMTGNRFGQ